ncbi:hypothetical protein BJB45_01575 [Halomonas huangheensis]|uniref:Uncharacterized protein n=1 Tax=Halomonas huangheensis TaxID=1178482 RepID=W1N2W7_9GAMM|nr:hypothetical protein BJB45_01575 [Halomonas huangheensis]
MLRMIAVSPVRLMVGQYVLWLSMRTSVPLHVESGRRRLFAGFKLWYLPVFFHLGLAWKRAALGENDPALKEASDTWSTFEQGADTCRWQRDTDGPPDVLS